MFIIDDKIIVYKTVAYIEDNLDQDLNLDEVAQKTGYSKFHLNRIFSESVGCTIYKYIQMRRLTEAARQLTKTQKPIIEIALDANYQSHQAFTNAFSQLYLCSPQVYRTIGIFIPKQKRFTKTNICTLLWTDVNMNNRRIAA